MYDANAFAVYIHFETNTNSTRVWEKSGKGTPSGENGYAETHR